MSFYRTILLNFFGYKSKLGNRRSDYYDALHSEYGKACHLFVTEDTRLQEKLGDSNGPFGGTGCLLLNIESFEQAMKVVISSHGST